MKFKYYVLDTMDGQVFCTNSDEEASAFSNSEDYFVVDTSTGEWLQINEKRVPIEGISS